MNTAELRGPEQFPVDAAHTELEQRPATERQSAKLTAYDFAQNRGSYPFSVSREAIAKQLREMADKVESRSIVPMRIQVTTEAHRADYVTSALIFEFAERD